MKKNIKNAAAIVVLVGFAALVLGCAATPFTQGRNALENGNYELAITMFTESIRREPALRGSAYSNRGNAHMLIGEYDKAITDFQ